MHTPAPSRYDRLISLLKRRKLLLGPPLTLLMLWLCDLLLTYTVFYYQAHRLSADICSRLEDRSVDFRNLDYPLYHIGFLDEPARRLFEKWNAAGFKQCISSIRLGDPAAEQLWPRAPAEYTLHVKLIGTNETPDKLKSSANVRLSHCFLCNVMTVVSEPARRRSAYTGYGITKLQAFVERWGHLWDLSYEGHYAVYPQPQNDSNEYLESLDAEIDARNKTQWCCGD
jgi:hypothetical protein